MSVLCGYNWGYPLMQKKDPTSFKFRVNATDLHILENLSKLFGISRSGVIKVAIRRLWEVAKDRWQGGRTRP
jgi:hypothetical protein